MASESPYEALGRPLEQDPPNRSIRLFGGEAENAFTLAHKATGEWRNWRDLLDANGITDPFNIQGIQAQGDSRAAEFPEELDVDPFAELDQEIRVIYASEPLSGPLWLKVEDVASGYEVSAGFGSGAYQDATLVVPDLLTQDVFSVPLMTEDGCVELEFTSGGWLLFWLAREITLDTDFAASRDILLVP